jgi:hypothetical protein
LGQGAFNSGWHAHQLAKPGEFLISDPEHTAPEPNRAYLLTDEKVTDWAAHCAQRRPRPAASQPSSCHFLPPRNGVVGRPSGRRPRRGAGGGPRGRVRHEPELGLPPATGTCQSRPGCPGPARPLARCPATTGAGPVTPAMVTHSDRPEFVHGPRAYAYRPHTRRGHGRGQPRTVTAGTGRRKQPTRGGAEGR